MPQLSECRYTKRKSFKEILKKAASFVYYSALLPKPEKPQEAPPENSVAVVFLAALGDMVVFCDAARKMKACGKRITLICRRGGGIAEFARLTLLFDEIIELDISGACRCENIKILRELRVDAVFCAPLGRHILPDVYACAIKAKHRFFPDTLLDCSLPSLKKRIDKHADKLIKLTETHELKRYTEFLLTCGLIDEALEPFRLQLPKTHRNKTLAVFPGAGGGEAKQWAPKNFASVIKELLEKRLITKVYILGASSDSVCCDELYRLIQQKGRDVENLCGKTDIKELIDMLKGCCLTLANDSASAHISIACDTPTIIICGMWQYGRFYPNPKLNSDCVSLIDKKSSNQSCNSSRPLCGISPAPCISGISADEVFECAAGILSKSEGKKNAEKN